MKNAAEPTAVGGNGHSVLDRQSLGNCIARLGPRSSDSRYDQAADEADQSAEEKSVRLTVDRIIAFEQVVAGLDVDYHLGDRIRRDRKMPWCSGLDQKAGAEVERGGRHALTSNLALSARFFVAG